MSKSLSLATSRQEQLAMEMEMIAGEQREGGTRISIDRGLPAVSIEDSFHGSYYFQEHEAEELLQQADRSAEDLGIDAETYLLYVSASW